MKKKEYTIRYKQEKAYCLVITYSPLLEKKSIYPYGKDNNEFKIVEVYSFKDVPSDVDFLVLVKAKREGEEDITLDLDSTLRMLSLPYTDSCP